MTDIRVGQSECSGRFVGEHEISDFSFTEMVNATTLLRISCQNFFYVCELLPLTEGTNRILLYSPTFSIQEPVWWHYLLTITSVHEAHNVHQSYELHRIRSDSSPTSDSL